MFGARRHIPSLASLLALEAVDRLGTASAAADELALTQGAVSRQIKVLEDQLGQTLFRREGQRLKVTAAATAYATEVRAALQSLARAGQRLRADPGRDTLRLAILPAFGMHWLVPRLPGFARIHPGIQIELATRLRPFDMAAEGFDAAIHYGRDNWPGADHLLLMDEDLLAVASPALSLPLPAADRVLTLPLLQLESRRGDWRRWLAHHGLPGQHPPAMQFDHFATMKEAALHGLGAALLPPFLIEAELSDERLAPLYGPAVPAAGRYSLVWPRDPAPRPALAAFRNWLAGQIGAR